MNDGSLLKEEYERNYSKNLQKGEKQKSRQNVKNCYQYLKENKVQ